MSENRSDYDDTDMSPEEFERRMGSGSPVMIETNTEIVITLPGPRRMDSRSKASAFVESIPSYLEVRGQVVRVVFEPGSLFTTGFLDQLCAEVLEDRGAQRLQLVGLGPAASELARWCALDRGLLDRVEIS